MTILGVVAANILFGAIIILLIGSNPIEAYWALLVSSFGDLDAITNVLTRSAPLLLSGLAVTVAFTAGIYNLGGEGQIYLGALVAAVTGSVAMKKAPSMAAPPNKWKKGDGRTSGAGIANTVAMTKIPTITATGMRQLMIFM